MNIGFDLDKIFIDYPPFVPAALIDRLYKQRVNGALYYRIPSQPEQWFRVLTHHPILRPPISKNIEFVRKKASKNSDSYYLISSRFGFLRKRTNEIVKKYNFNKIFDGMFFNFANEQPHIFKKKSVEKLKLDYYVDDDLPLLCFLAKDIPKTMFFWFNRKKHMPMAKNLIAITQFSQMFNE